MAQMNISNTLWNDTKEALLAYVKQLKDDTINWNDNQKKYNGSYPNPDYDPEDPSKGPERIPYIPNEPDPDNPNAFYKSDNNKFQSKLNEFFLNHWADFMEFLHDNSLNDGVIDSWREVQEFLHGLPEGETKWLQETIARLDNRITAMDIPEGGAYDISAANVDGDNKYAEYANLEAALADVPSESKKPGMSIRFINSVTKKYEQWRYLLEDKTDTNFLSVSNWTRGGGSGDGAFDVSTENLDNGNPTYYASLNAILSSQNLNTLIPPRVRTGGMTIKFILDVGESGTPVAGDYVQYRYMGTVTTGSNNPFVNVANWQGTTSEIKSGNKDLVESGGVYQGLIDVGYDVNIVKGMINSTTGADHFNVTNRVKTDCFLKAPLKVKTSGDYLLRRFEYHLDGTYTNVSSTWLTQDVQTDTTKLYKFSFKINDESDITPSDAKPYIKIYNGLKYNIDYLGGIVLRADLKQSFSMQERAHLQSNIGLDEKLAEFNDNLIYIQEVISANIHNSADATAASSPEPTDGSDWEGHIVNNDDASFISVNELYNVSYYIAVTEGIQYKCNKNIRRIGYYKSDYTPISTADGISAGTAITLPEDCAFVRISYRNNYKNMISKDNTPANVKFGKYSDDINVPYMKKYVDKDFLDRELALNEDLNAVKKDLSNLEESIGGVDRIVTSVGSSGLDVNCGGQYCLTEIQKQTYNVTNDLCVTRVVQKLIGYDKANVCAYSGFPASLIYFANGSSPLILKNSVTLISSTAVPYTFDLTTIGAPMTQNLTVLATNDIGTFIGILNGYNVTVDAVSGTITLNDVVPSNVVIPAGAMLYREVKHRTVTGSGVVTKGLAKSTGLILQVGANSEGDTPEEIFNYCELAIKESGCKWFVVLRKNTQGNLNYDTAETTGGSDLNKAAKLLRTKYGSRFIDHMAYMTSRKSLSDQGITPTTSAQYPDENGQNSNPLTQQQIEHDIPCDMECIATRRVPSSFWYGAWRSDDVPTNETHFNAQGLECLGKYIYTMVHRMGF